VDIRVSGKCFLWLILQHKWRLTLGDGHFLRHSYFFFYMKSVLYRLFHAWWRAWSFILWLDTNISKIDAGAGATMEMTLTSDPVITLQTSTVLKQTMLTTVIGIMSTRDVVFLSTVFVCLSVRLLPICIFLGTGHQQRSFVTNFFNFKYSAMLEQDYVMAGARSSSYL
jgi:hypothetical protein